MRAASYSRRSNSRGKRRDEKSVTEQDELSLRTAQRNAWDLPPNRMFRDNDLSASRFSNKERPDWNRLHGTLADGQIDVLIMWETSRAWRDFPQWVDLVELCAETSTLVHIETDGRTYDPNNDRDWESLMEDGIDSEKLSRKISRNVKRTMNSNKEQGRPHSRPPYGYEIQIDPNDPRQTIRAIAPEHASIVKEVITRVAKSEAQSAIERDLIQRGIPSPSVAQGLKPDPRSNGKIPQWSRAMIRRICNNEAYIGMRGSVPATWEPIMKTEEEIELFHTARNLLKDPKRKTTKPGSQRHLLAFFGTCEVCGSYITRMGGRNPERYKCSSRNACVTIRKDWLDTFIEELTCRRLAKPDVFDAITHRDNTPLYAELNQLRADHNEALDLRAKNKLSLMALSQEESRLLPRITELEAQLESVTIPQTVRDLVKDATNNVAIIRRRWGALPVSAQKDVLRTFYESITVGKAPYSGRFTTDEQIAWMLKLRVHVRWIGQED